MSSPSTSQTKKVDSPKWNSPPANAGFKKFLWDSDAKAFMGRTGSSWAKIGLFYIVFYSFLAGFFSLMMAVFYQTLNDKEPSYVGDASILRTPGLGFRPFLDMESKRHVLSYHLGDKKAIKKLAEDIDTLLEPYREQNDTLYQDCTTGNRGEKQCGVNVQDLEEVCKPDNQWGYADRTPIFFFKLNKMIGFVPEPPQNTTDLPQTLKDYLKSNNLSVSDKVWVWCESEDEGVTLEHSSPGLPLYYYPYYFKPNYLQPLSCVRLSGLPDGKEVKMTCSLWANNIPHTSKGRSTGRANFVIKISTKKME